MQLLTTELGWSYRIRVKGNTWVWRGISGWCQLQDVHCHRGEAVCLHNVTAQGDEVVASGQRRRIDTHWFRGNNYFRIGWEWVKAAALKGWQVITVGE